MQAVSGNDLVAALMTSWDHNLLFSSTAPMCTTKTCVTVASSILNAMDDTIDPCEDFYQFACGGWIKAHPIPPGESRWDAFGVMRKENQVVLKNILGRLLDSSLVSVVTVICQNNNYFLL